MASRTFFLSLSVCLSVSLSVCLSVSLSVSISVSLTHTGDLGSGALGVLRLLMLAQAQECALLKAMSNSYGSGLVAGIASQVYLHYFPSI